MKILANHAHVFPSSINPNGTIDRLLRMLDACGIESAVCFAPFPYQAKDAAVQPNKWLADELKRYPRLHGFGTVDFHRDDVRDQIKAAKDLGLRGLKLHPNAQEFDILSKEAFKAYEAAQDLKMFITFHSGVHHARLLNYAVTKFDEVAFHFPNLRFSLEHVGGYSFFNEALAVIVNNIPFPPVPGRTPGVFGGLTSIFTPDYNRMWYMNSERMKELFAQAGPEQLIFGLDFPYNLEPQTKTALDTLRGLGLSEGQLALVLGGNLRRELGISEENTRADDAAKPPPAASPD